MTDRMLSGHEPLDAVLGGGLPANAISLIMGLPGTGKTIIAQQYVFRNGQPGASCGLFLHGFRAAGEDRALRPEPGFLRPRCDRHVGAL